MQVTKGGFHQIDFDRQIIIGNYIVDFYVKSLWLVIEIDGSSHNNNEVYDFKREDFLKSLGLKIFRINVNDILKNIYNVKLGLENFLIENYGVI